MYCIDPIIWMLRFAGKGKDLGCHGYCLCSFRVYVMSPPFTWKPANNREEKRSLIVLAEFTTKIVRFLFYLSPFFSWSGSKYFFCWGQESTMGLARPSLIVSQLGWPPPAQELLRPPQPTSGKLLMRLSICHITNSSCK